jgi:allantoinase
LAVGRDADIAIAKKEPYTYRASESGHNFVDWSPYDGRHLSYRIVGAYLRGEPVFGPDSMAEPGTGRFISPPPVGISVATAGA